MVSCTSLRRLSTAARAPPRPTSGSPPAGRPGPRAPRGWLAGGRSSLDLFGKQFVVLRPAAAGVDDWAPPGASSHVIDAEAYGLSAGGALLVRPDGAVAWRSRG